jgi:hypothetical protein
LTQMLDKHVVQVRLRSNGIKKDHKELQDLQVLL